MNDARQWLERMHADIDQRLAKATPLGERAAYLRSMLWFSATGMAMTTDAGIRDKGLEQGQRMLEARDVARDMQRRIDAVFKDRVPDTAHGHAMQALKMNLAALEFATGASMGFMLSERADEGLWWAGHAGSLMAKLVLSVGELEESFPDAALD